MDSNMVKERILGVCRVLWGGEDIGQSLKHRQVATVLSQWVLHEGLPVG